MVKAKRGYPEIEEGRFKGHIGVGGLILAKIPTSIFKERMRWYERKIITIKVNGASQGQWSNLLLELNLMRKAWKGYGVDISLKAPGIRSVIEWGDQSK